jgi:hypothetical protein
MSLLSGGLNIRSHMTSNGKRICINGRAWLGRFWSVDAIV